MTDYNRKNKDQNSNKRFALFTWSSYFLVFGAKMGKWSGNNHDDLATTMTTAAIMTTNT